MDYQKVYWEAVNNNTPIPQQPNIFGKYIIELCRKLGTRYNFNGYSYVDIMISEAQENCIKAITKYDPSKTDNIFNYFTTVAWRAFQFRIIDERKQNAVKHKYYQHTYRINEIEGQIVSDLSNNEYSNRVIDEYEEKHLNKTLTTQKKNDSVEDIEKVLIEDTKDVKNKNKAPSRTRANTNKSKRTSKRRK